MKLIDISTPRYPNTFTIVDDADFGWLNQWKWRMESNGYAARGKRKGGKYYTIYMHLEILKPPPGMRGDHRFGNKLDNRRENLRICTHAQNMRNSRPTPGRSLPKGVNWDKKRQKFKAQIMVNRRQINIGRFPTEAEAEAAYNAAAIKYHGEFARTGKSEQKVGE